MPPMVEARSPVKPFREVTVANKFSATVGPGSNQRAGIVA